MTSKTVLTGPQKTLSLLQPWAFFLTIGGAYSKNHETRSWATQHRGPLLIHASAGWNKACTEACETVTGRALLKMYGITDPKKELTRGAIVGAVTLKDVRTVATMAAPAAYLSNGLINPANYGYTERELGNWNEGRKIWLCTDHLVISKPLKIAGKLQLWNYDLGPDGAEFYPYPLPV